MIQWGRSASPPALVNECEKKTLSPITLGLTLKLGSLKSELWDTVSSNTQPNFHMLRAF